MRLCAVVMFCLPWIGVWALDVQSGGEAVRGRMRDSCESAARLGREYLGKACELFEKGRSLVYTRVQSMVSGIRRRCHRSKEIVGPVDGERSGDEEAFDLSPEDIERLIEEIKRKLAGYMDMETPGEEKGGEEVKEESSEKKGEKEEEKKEEL